MAKARKKRTAQSPYVKYDKAPFLYSDLHQRWQAAVKAGKHSEARDLAAQHARRFGPVA